MVQQPLLIIGDYQQQCISSGPKTTSDGSLEPLLMMFSIVVLPEESPMGLVSSGTIPPRMVKMDN
jgi:hypothetical protein